LLFVVNDSRFFVSHRLPLGEAARRCGYEVHLAAFPNGQLDVLTARGIVFHPLPFDRTGLNPWRDAQLLGAFLTLLRQVRPTMMHCITLKPAVYGGLLAQRLGVEGFVVSLTGLGQVFQAQRVQMRLARAIACRLLRLAFRHGNSRVIFQNPDDRAELIAADLVRAENCVLIRGSGVDPQVYRPQPEPEGVPIVLLPARLLWAKGVGEFVAAARAVRAVGCPARFVLAGEAPPHNRSSVPAETLRRWQDEGIVEWWGHREDMPGVLAASSIVCLPSYYREGVPKSLIEGASCGRPIVTTDMPGCREICRTGENGFLVPPRDPAALAAAIVRLLGDPLLRRAMGSRGREIAQREFSLDRIVAETLSVYHALQGAGRVEAMPDDAGPTPALGVLDLPPG
jgi:glycosyltransferase involved in cell wall biosynthesis